ncbi:DEAD/DEAH box helicase [Porphyromonas crevioricanis]|uniref:DEAD-box ATP-dependent RNA helicase CshA n=2 Tax=Porphyromonas crevioricanis TaxID=393921 RepID=A0A2X4PWI9_9PORP|nr:DEAD/DEAH box helicase [Porphyromonas crevioricanis]GAD04423.1 ATP-dependent RNA helicase [Porphyromonas crevioricanis JCM 15906]GAD07281.1 ATP-dependent RNA helicase [Porphyromonas crevioricanis JCM 13913]SJZ68496.1 Superfamily II DNA and RNA helicase [Porphyromonas crevioricanis]SQH72227.1 DEAD-box ATP-dependent RNA helicase CshA [Porphyromonas crevioricanis]
MRFDEFDLSDEVLDGLDAMNFFEATPIQEATIPLILEGHDLIACAQTGTGKTAAYVLPIISELNSGKYPSDAVNAVIMAPTRELAQQIDQQIEAFSYFLSVSAVAIYGGTDGIAWEQQRKGMEMGADVLIATPGRLISHINMKSADLSQVSFFVLDEADRMLDMGFYDDIMQVYKQLPKTCQTLMFSATMPKKIRELAAGILKNPKQVEIAISRPPEAITQTCCICYDEQKLPILLDLFAATPPSRTIIFSSSKQKVKDLTQALKQRRYNATAMHSDLDQSVREQVIRDFKNRSIDILVATDIVARGIDVDNVTVVINYDIPRDPEDYVHRIGRTARNNESGLAITLVGESEQYEFSRIEEFLGKKLYQLPIPTHIGATPAYEPNKLKRGRFSSGRGHGGNRVRKPDTNSARKEYKRDEKSQARDSKRQPSEHRKANTKPSGRKDGQHLRQHNKQRLANKKQTPREQ